MYEFEIKEIKSSDIPTELKKIGFDEGYRFVAADKFKYKNLKIFNLSPAQANIVKQTAISVGADCGCHRDVISGKIEKSNAILCGNYLQLKKIGEKLQNQPFKLGTLGNSIKNFLEPINRATKLAGILNVTPDSFSDGGMYNEPVSAQKHLVQMIEDGAELIDIGAESTRPYSKEVSAKEQKERLEPILEFINKENIRVPISVDTRSSEVADYALNHGISIINDVSGLTHDKNMASVISGYKAGVIIQHTQGSPEIMQNSPHYEDVVEEIYFKLKERVDYALAEGVSDIIIDPGIGFGKTQSDNFEIINRIEEFFSLDFPIMVGISRKSLLGISENDNNLKDSLSAAISYPLIQKGVDYLRVHNVKLHKYLIDLNKNF